MYCLCLFLWILKVTCNQLHSDDFETDWAMYSECFLLVLLTNMRKGATCWEAPRWSWPVRQGLLRRRWHHGTSVMVVILADFALNARNKVYLVSAGWGRLGAAGIRLAGQLKSRIHLTIIWLMHHVVKLDCYCYANKRWKCYYYPKIRTWVWK